MEQKNCSVYFHKAPNNKVYIGQTSKNPVELWNNGNLYTNLNDQRLYQDIQKYGWENFKHDIIYTDLSRKEAIEKKKELCLQYQSYIPEYGYNSLCDAGITKKPKKKESEVKRINSATSIQDNYTVYVHVLPNQKIYVGQTAKSVKARWKDHGIGYKHNTAFYSAIQKYGWDNIHHIIICDTLSKMAADYLEQYLIEKYNTTDIECGYNKHFEGELFSKKEYGERRKFAEYLIQHFIQDKKVMSTLMWLMHGTSLSKLVSMKKYVETNSDYIDKKINTMEFKTISKKAGYLLAIIKNNAS